MSLLKRNHAPILSEAWDAIDEEAMRVLKLNLAGRKLVDFKGPHGWSLAAVNTGRLEMLKEAPVADVTAGVRSVQPVVELRSNFRLDIGDLDSIARGAVDPDLSEVVKAAERIARAEDSAIFNGYKAGQIDGIIDTSPHAPITVSAVEAWPQAIVSAKETLRAAGVAGPYAIALGRKAYDELSAGSEDGYPLRKRVERNIIDGLFVWAPAIEGAVVLSTRGGDFELTVGQDLSIGYTHHDKNKVELYITESFTFRVLEPTAAVVLKRS
jgi:uncharacterized linocin/CFP29 family protein